VTRGRWFKNRYHPDLDNILAKENDHLQAVENKSVRYYKPLTAHQVKLSLNEGRPEAKFARDTKSVDTKSAYILKLVLRYGAILVVYQSTRQTVIIVLYYCSMPACVCRFPRRVERAFRI